ncbi:phosphohexomutase domain-containing protein [Thalassoroseus pseudoceratinae]|uniref:hypothetical protein n=1 Tax=Thalassoroseus pseudoceratinae TaxID=2713176 RepID=UPI001422B777|nr:hypothetical protein [Thalassoroseus pseudoceratinae]
MQYRQFHERERMPFDPPNETTYICPGETHTISRSVHLARMAAFYPACRDCPFRSETGHLPQDTIDRLQQTERRAVPCDLFNDEGVRGVYLNELTRRQAELIAAAFASVLWSRSPLVGRMVESAADGANSNRSVNPSIVVGYDDRPSAPDIFSGAVQGLRRMSCDVLDIGLTAKPALQFAVEQFNAVGGLLVTGAGCDPSRIGMDFVGTDGTPISRSRSDWESITLADIEHAVRDPYHRPTRNAGVQSACRISDEYTTGLSNLFPVLAPFTVVVGCSVPMMMRTLASIFDERSYRFVSVNIPRRVRDVNEITDSDVARVAEAVHESQADLGILIDDDGGRCSFITEGGELLSAWTLLPLLVESLQTEVPRRPVVLEPHTPTEVEPQLIRQGISWVRGGGSHAEMAQAMRDHNAVLGGGESGRVWIANPSPTCDAIGVLAHVLTVLSRHQMSLSRLVEMTGTLKA